MRIALIVFIYFLLLGLISPNKSPVKNISYAGELNTPCISDHFTLKELTCPDMDKQLLCKLLKLRTLVNKRIFIHSGFRQNDPGMHGKKKAFDIHIEGLSIKDQYLAAEEIGFGGIGVYPHWNRPGLHIDVRKKHLRWITNKKGRYFYTNKKDLIRRLQGE